MQGLRIYARVRLFVKKPLMQEHQENLKELKSGLRKAGLTALLMIAFFGAITYLDHQSEIKKNNENLSYVTKP